MITKKIGGKLADIFFLDDKWNIVEPENATFAKAVFRAGGRAPPHSTKTPRIGRS
jgi:hypothetical protein